MTRPLSEMTRAELVDEVVRLQQRNADLAAPDVSEPVAWATRLYNTAYHAGHHDTVEGGYTHVYPQDMDSHHEDTVQEWLANNPHPAVQGEPVAWVTADTVDGQTVNGKPRRVWWENNEGVGTPIYTAPQPAEQQQPAPELYGALQKMVEMASTGMVDFNPHDEFVMSTARSALAKARGDL